MAAPALKHWETKTSTGSHFDVIDGLRGMAILLVIVYHTFYTNPSASKIQAAIGYLIYSGWMGVPVFFVLSGFLISHPFFKARSVNPDLWYPPGYALRRIGKILPPFYLSIIIFSLFYWWRFHDVIYLRSAVRWATGLESYQLPLSNFNLSYWSLMVEAHFYVVLPVLFFLTRRLTLAKTAVVIVLLLLLVPLLLRCLAWPPGISTLPASRLGGDIGFFLERTPFCVLDDFAFGVAFAAVFTALKPQLMHCKKLAILGYIGAVALGLTLIYWAYACKQFGVHVSQQHWSIETFKYLPSVSTLLLLFFVFDPACFGARILSFAWLRFIGLVSYEWFLFHGPMVSWFRDVFGQTEGSVWMYAGKTILPLTITFVFSVLVYRCFSLPILNRVREHLNKQAKTPLPTGN